MFKRESPDFHIESRKERSFKNQIREFYQTRTTKLLLLLLAFVGFSIAVLSSTGVEISWIPLEKQFGLLQVLPWHFWTGFAICLCSTIVGFKIDSERVFLLKILFLFLLIWGLPVFFEGNASVWDTYVHWGGVMEIVNSGSVPSYDINAYTTNWPGSYIFMGMSKIVPNIDSYAYVKFYPLLSAGLTIVALHLFLKNYLPRDLRRMTILVIVFLNVWFQFHASPQSVGLVLGILTLVCLEREGTPWKMIAIVLFASLLVSHATTMFVIVAAISCGFFLQKTNNRARNPQSARRETRYPAILFVVMAISWLLWNALGTSETLMKSLASQVGQIFLIETRAEGILAVRTTENIYPIPPNIRIAVIGFFILITLLYVVLRILMRLLSKAPGASEATRPSLTVPLSLFIISFILAAGDITIFGGQFYDRNILFIAIVSPIFAMTFATWLKKDKPFLNPIGREMKDSSRSRWVTIFIVCLFVAGLANFTTVFYQENFYVVSDASFSARDFTKEYFSAGTEIEGGEFPADFEDFSEGEQDKGNPGSVVILDIHNEIWRRQWLGIEQYESLRSKTRTMNMTYENGEYEMFWESTT